MVVAVVGVVVLVVLVRSDPVGVGERDVSQDLMRVCWNLACGGQRSLYMCVEFQSARKAPAE